MPPGIEETRLVGKFRSSVFRRGLRRPCAGCVCAATLAVGLALCGPALADGRAHAHQLPHTLGQRWLRVARGGVVRATGGVELRVAPHVMLHSGRASITEVARGEYAIHIAAPWRGAVTVALPLTHGLPIVAHRVLGEWKVEPARAVGGRAIARVRRLSLFGDLAKCIKPQSLHGFLVCALKAGVHDIPQTIFQQIVDKIIPPYDPCRPINFSIDYTDLLAACPAVDGPPPSSHPPTPPAPPTSHPGSTPAPQPTPVTPTPPPAGTTTYPHHVFGTCADGACGLKIRSGSGYSWYAQIGSLVDGDAVQVLCQAIGETVGPSPATGNSSAIWDELAGGGWVSDLYIDTPNVGAFSPPIPQC
jgi:hypothetical protein